MYNIMTQYAYICCFAKFNDTNIERWFRLFCITAIYFSFTASVQTGVIHIQVPLSYGKNFEIVQEEQTTSIDVKGRKSKH
jgi:type IV secretory pathway component VirB8